MKQGTYSAPSQIVKNLTIGSGMGIEGLAAKRLILVAMILCRSANNGSEPLNELIKKTLKDDKLYECVVSSNCDKCSCDMCSAENCQTGQALIRAAYLILKNWKSGFNVFGDGCCDPSDWIDQMPEWVFKLYEDLDLLPYKTIRKAYFIAISALEPEIGRFNDKPYIDSLAPIPLDAFDDEPFA